MDFETWKRCCVCGAYYFTAALRCTQSEQHEQPAPLLLISNRQYMRLLIVLEAVREKLPATQREAFGLFYLGLEEVNNRPCPGDTALTLFQQRSEARQEEERTVES